MFSGVFLEVVEIICYANYGVNFPDLASYFVGLSRDLSNVKC